MSSTAAASFRRTRNILYRGHADMVRDVWGGMYSVYVQVSPVGVACHYSYRQGVYTGGDSKCRVYTSRQNATLERLGVPFRISEWQLGCRHFY
ncbi:hypothetical protein AB1N83_005157 [Pleurotus pulmonarius]